MQPPAEEFQEITVPVDPVGIPLKPPSPAKLWLSNFVHRVRAQLVANCNGATKLLNASPAGDLQVRSLVASATQLWAVSQNCPVGPGVLFTGPAAPASIKGISVVARTNPAALSISYDGLAWQGPITVPILVTLPVYPPVRFCRAYGIGGASDVSIAWWTD